MSPERPGAALLLAPSLLLLLVLFYLPQALLFAVSLGRRSAYGGVVRDVALENYLRALEPLYLGILGRSLALAAATTVLCLAVGFPVAWWLARRVPARLRGALLALVVLPFWTSFLVRMYAWIVLLRSEGIVNLALAAAGLPRAELLYNDFAVLSSMGRFPLGRSGVPPRIVVFRSRLCDEAPSFPERGLGGILNLEDTTSWPPFVDP